MSAVCLKPTFNHVYLFPCQSAPAITKQIKKANKAADLLISLLHSQGETTF